MLLEPTIKYIESFTVSGLSVRTQNSDEFNGETAKLPALWQQFYSSGLAAQGNVFEVYSNYESDAHGLYTVTVGIEADAPQSVKIEAGNYLVFQGKGAMPATVVTLWTHIWNYFAVETKYQRQFISDFEAYTGADEVAIYIGVK